MGHWTLWHVRGYAHFMEKPILRMHPRINKEIKLEDFWEAVLM